MDIGSDPQLPSGLLVRLERHSFGCPGGIIQRIGLLVGLCSMQMPNASWSIYLYDVILMSHGAMRIGS